MTIDEIKARITASPVILFMKGSPEAPQCGFSMRASQALAACGTEFDHVDVLSEPETRANLSACSNWPTFPQLFIQGELVGGCDIILELYGKGELQKMLQNTALAS